MNKSVALRSLLLVVILGLLAGARRDAAIPVTRVLEADGRNPYPRVVVWQPSFESFRASVMNGKAGQLAGVFVPQTLAFPIVQQPAGAATYVSTDPGVVTQFGAPSGYGTVGLLAHNNLAGADFYKLQTGQTFFLIYGDGSVAAYLVESIRQFQALSPENPYSNFVDLNNPGTQLTSGDLYAQIYTQPNKVVFQTCLDRNGNPSWGRTFITAKQRDFSTLLSIPSYHTVFAN